jgi:hypothetical protein
MTIRYKNTFADVLWFAAYTYTYSPVLLCIYALIGVCSLYLATVSVPAEAQLPARIFAVTVLFLLILGIFFTVFAVITVLSLVSKANRTILTDHSITIRDDVLVEESPFSRTEQKWTGIPRLVRTRRHIFAYISQYAAHVIPRRAFPDAQEFDRFYAELNSHVQKVA